MRQFSEQATSALPQTIGQAGIFEDRKPNALDYLQQAQRNKAEQSVKQKAARDKDIADKLKYAPDAIWHPFTEEHNQNIKGLLDDRANLINSNDSLEYNSPKFKEFEKKKFDIQQNVARADDIKKSYFDIVNNKTPFTNQGVVFSKLNDYVMGEPGKRKKAAEIEVNDMYKVVDDPETLAPTEMTQEFVKSIPEKVNQIVKTKAINVGADKGVYFDEVKEASKFYTTDSNGKPVINITPETKAMFYGMDKRVQPYVQMELQKKGNENKTEDDIIAEMISPFAYSNKTVNRSGITKESDSGKDDKADYEHLFNTEENYNLNKTGGSEKEVTKSWSPHEIRIGQKETDTPLIVNAENFVDPNTNSTIKDANGKPLVGDQKITISRLRLLPFDAKTGKYLPGTEAEIEAYKKAHPNNGIDLKWYGTGTMHTKDEDGEKQEKPILVPYDQIKVDLAMKKKLNLDDRAPSEYSNAELLQFINKNFPKLTTEQKKAKFKEFRNQ